MDILKTETEILSKLLMPKDREIVISMAIVAHNESDYIGTMLNSLFQQSLLSQCIPQLHIELIVLPNGCTDNTAEVARQTIDSLIDTSVHKNLKWDVKEINLAGKSNAWNLFVHEFSSQESEYLFLMDSDIQLLEEDTLHSMLKTILQQSQAIVVVDKPIKDVSLKPNKTLRDRLSTSISGLSGGKATEGGPAWICGQLYCAKAKALRQIWLPTTLPAQDAFLYTMLVTQNLQSEQNPNHVILAGSASHQFEAYTSIRRLLKHERWLILSSAVNELLFSRLKEAGMVGNQAGTYIMKNNHQNPQWLSDLVKAETGHRRWLIPRFILIRRFVSLMKKPVHKAFILLPIATAAFIVDLILSFQANQNLHQGIGLKHWGKQSQPSS